MNIGDVTKLLRKEAEETLQDSDFIKELRIDVAADGAGVDDSMLPSLAKYEDIEGETDKP